MKNMRRAAGFAALAAGIAGLSGCSYLQVGEEEFSCSGMPGSIYCHSSREVYEATNDGTVPSPMRPGAAYNEECEDCVKSELDGGPAQGDDSGGLRLGESDAGAKPVQTAQTEDDVIRNYVTPALPERPVPIRTPSQVMRIWVAPFVDEAGDFHAPGFVYTEIEPRRWVLAKEHETASNFFEPLDPKTNMESAADGGQAQGHNTLQKLKQSQQRRNAAP